jgi:uncharacterized lipoprotein
MPIFNPRPAILGLAAALLASGCSWFGGDEKPPYYASENGKRLEIPEGLDAPDFVSPLMIVDRQAALPDRVDTRPPRVASTAGRGDANAWLAWASDGVYLKVKDTPDSVARRLGFAIERSGMRVLDEGDGGEYAFEYLQPPSAEEGGFFSKLAFWRDSGPDYSGAYRTEVRADGEEARVYLRQPNGDPAAPEAAEHVLAVFMERLG